MGLPDAIAGFEPDPKFRGGKSATERDHLRPNLLKYGADELPVALHVLFVVFDRDLDQQVGRCRFITPCDFLLGVVLSLLLRGRSPRVAFVQHLLPRRDEVNKRDRTPRYTQASHVRCSAGRACNRST